MKRLLHWLLPAIVFLVAGCVRPLWSEHELATLRSLSLAQLPPLPADSSNAVAENLHAAALGRKLFFDTRLSANGTVSCATCHQPERYFTDGRARARGVADFTLNSMTLIGSAWSPWQTWNGKADSQWMQATLPLENAAEHGLDRTALAHLLAEGYAAEYAAIFGSLPPFEDAERFPAHAAPVAEPALSAAWSAMAEADRDAVNRVLANAGKALAAFERTIAAAPARFDAYVAAVEQNDRRAMETLLSAEEVAGLRLFIGKGHCINCHNGPLFTNFEFHNTAVPPVAGQPVQRGRVAGLEPLTASEFNCLGPYSDAEASQCSQLRFLVAEGEALVGAFRTPTLRNIAETAPYMHAGQFVTLGAALEHYNSGGLQFIGHNELTPLGLSEREVSQLELFLRTLTGDPPPNP